MEWRVPGNSGEDLPAGGAEAEVSLLFRRRWDLFQIFFVFEQLEREVFTAMTEPDAVEKMSLAMLRMQAEHLRGLRDRSDTAHPALSRDPKYRVVYTTCARTFQQVLRQCEQRIRRRGPSYRGPGRV